MALLPFFASRQRRSARRSHPRTGLWLEPLERRDMLDAGLPSLTNQLAATWVPTVQWVDVHLADVTGDGKADLVGRDPGTGDWWVGVSTGSGFVTTLWGSWSTNVTWTDVQVADVTGSGKADIVGRVAQTGQWWVAVSTGSAFVNELWTTWAPTVTWVDVHLADVTGDGKADLVGMVQQTGQWWVGVSTGSSFVDSRWAVWSPTVTWTDVNVADVTGDGKADLVGMVQQTGQWWVGVSTGSAFVSSLWTMWTPTVTWVDVQVADVTGDGKADLIGRVAQTGQWWVGVSSGVGFANQLWGSWAPGITWVDVQTADVNGDGRMDVVGREQENGEWWLASSTGLAFVNEPLGEWSPSVSWLDVQAGDVNGDGKADLVGRVASTGQWWAGLSGDAGTALPLSFEANEGQTNSQVQFLARTSASTVYLTPSQATVTTTVASSGTPTLGTLLTGGTNGTSTEVALTMNLAGASTDPSVMPLRLLPGKTNYLLGNNASGWLTGIPNYGQVEYQNVYPGVNVLYQGNGGNLEREFIVAPGASPGVITMDFPGATDLTIDASGDLVVTIGGVQFVQTAPVAFQADDTGTRAILIQYVLLGGTEVGFVVGPYDPTRTLTIDPTLDFSTFVGGSTGDAGNAIAVDASGDSYITGQTSSVNFPFTPGVVQPSLRGATNAFVTELNPSGTALIYSTYLGGFDTDVGTAIAVDALGDAYVAGTTNSANFPVTAGAFQVTNAGSTDGFVTELNPTGTLFNYSTFLGGTGADAITGIALLNGFAYVTGPTASTNFPLTANAIQTAPGNTSFVTELNQTGTAEVYSTLVGGTVGENITNAIAVDAAGSAYVTGQTTNTVDFPVTAGALQPTLKGGSDAFVLKLDPTGSFYQYATYLGGSADDIGKSIAVDGAGNAYITGSTQSTDLPTTAGAFQTTFVNTAATPVEAFVAKLNATGTALVYLTYLGGTGAATGGDVGNGIVLDSLDQAYVVGTTSSTAFPLVNPLQAVNNGNGDVFVTVLNAVGSSLLFSTFLGGTGADNGNGIALDTAGNIYITGSTSSSDFPITAGAFQTVNAGTSAFVAKISPFTVAAPVVTGISPTSGPTTGGTVVTITGSGFNGATAVEFGTTAAASFTVNSNFSITAITPAEPAGVVNVTVTTPIGSSATSAADQFTFVGPPPPPPPSSNVLAGPPNDAFEPNDTSETATNLGGPEPAQVLIGSELLSPLSINLHIVNGHPVYDQDWYTWHAGITGTFTASLLNIVAGFGVGAAGIANLGSTSSGTASSIDAAPTGATEVGTTVTISTSAGVPGTVVGQPVTISGVGVAQYNGTFIVTSVPTATTFTYTDPFTGLAASGGGTAQTSFSTPTGQVSSVTITNPGTGYTSAPIVTFTGGGGTGATGVATIANGQVTGVTITNPGTGYTSAPTVNFTSTGGDLNERVFVREPDGSLLLVGSSTLLGGLSAQTVSVPVQAGQQIYVWVYGYDFALGTYDLAVNLS